MKVTAAGAVQLPAEVRRRWNVDRVLVTDLGDHVVLYPIPEDPIAALAGKYAGMGPSSEEMRAQFRDEEFDAEERRNRQ